MSFSYQSLTRKQAGVVYRAYKSGAVKADKAAMSSMYRLVNLQERTPEETRDMFRFIDACGYILEGDYEKAQARLDGKHIYLMVVAMQTRIATEADADERWFDDVEPGDVIEEEVWEERILSKEERLALDDDAKVMYVR